jgi:hypothetical protein
MRKHLVATGDNPADQQPQQRRAGLCGCGGGGGRELASYAGSRSENLVRASVIS